MNSTPQEDTMVTSPTLDLFPEELAYRAADGIQVALLWHRHTNALTVAVTDHRSGDCFELAVDPADALDAFYHPYAYAAFNGVDYRAGARHAVYA